MVQIVAQTLSHDVLTPLKCANQILEAVQQQDSSFSIKDIEVVMQANEMLIG